MDNATIVQRPFHLYCSTDHPLYCSPLHPIAIVQRPSHRYCSMSLRTLRWPGALSIAYDFVSVVTAVVGGLSLGSLVRLFETVQCVYLTSGTVLGEPVRRDQDLSWRLVAPIVIIQM